MIKKIVFGFILFGLTFNFSYAQDDIVLGGKASCSVSGRTPVKKFVAEANRLLILQNEGISKGSIQLQLISDTENNLIDINILALLGETPDVEPFLNGKTINIQSVDSTFDIKNTVKSKNTTFEVNNTISETQSYNFRTKLKVKKTDENHVNGILNLILKNSTFVQASGGNTEPDTNNGRIVVRCKLKDIPLEIKELAL